jgi:hypothetical protein
MKRCLSLLNLNLAVWIAVPLMPFSDILIWWPWHMLTVHELRNMPYIHPSNSRSGHIRGRSIHRHTHEVRRSRNTLERSAPSCNQNCVLDREGRIQGRNGHIQGRGHSRSRRDRGRILNRGQVTPAKRTDSLYQFVYVQINWRKCNFVTVAGASLLINVQFMAAGRRNARCTACGGAVQRSSVALH